MGPTFVVYCQHPPLNHQHLHCGSSCFIEKHLLDFPLRPAGLYNQAIWETELEKMILFYYTSSQATFQGSILTEINYSETSVRSLWERENNEGSGLEWLDAIVLCWSHRYHQHSRLPQSCLWGQSPEAKRQFHLSRTSLRVLHIQVPHIGALWGSVVGFTGAPPYVPLEPVNMTLFGKGVFADGIKFRILRWEPPGLRWA